MLKLKSGDRRTVRMTVLQDDGVSPVDLSNVTLKFQAGASLAGPALISKSSGGDLTIVTPLSGIIDIDFYPDDTKDLDGKILVYELEITNASDPLDVSTVYFAAERRFYSIMYIEPDLIVAA